MALTHLLKAQGYAVTAAHLDHGLRTSSRDDAGAVARFCAELGVPLVTERVEGLSRGEAAARAARYDFLARAARRVGSAKVAVAHTADDQAETVLLRLIRGAGADGLRGMPRERRLAPGILLVRPILDWSRAQVLAYCEEHNLSYVTDESNRDPAFLRNRIRHQLLPLLEREYNPGIRAVLLRTARSLTDDAAALDAIAGSELEGVDPDRGIELQRLRRLPVAIQRRLVRALWKATTALPPLGADHVEQALRGDADLPQGWHAEHAAGRLRLHRRSRTAPSPPFEYRLPVPGSVDVPEANVRIVATGSASGPLTVRSRRPGDRLVPWGGQGHRKLQDLLVDAKVPRGQRDRIAIVTGPDQTILWVVGIRRSEALRGSDLRLDAVPLS